MPFDPTRPIAQNPLTVGLSSYDKPDPSFLETLGAAYRQENLIGSALSSARVDMSTAEFNKIDPTYNPFEDITGYEQYADRFEKAYNPAATAAIKSDIDKETRDRETLHASGMTGMGLSMLAGVTDPTILIPAGAMMRAGEVGYSVARSAASVALGTGVGVAVQEAGLQASQETRTLAESAMNVGGSVILGGIVGAAGAKFLSHAEWNRASASIKEDLTGVVPNPDEVTQVIVSRMQSAGASAVDDIKLDDLGVGGPKAAQVVARATAAAKINPGVQTMFSPSVKVREVYNQLVDSPIYTRMNMEGQTLGPSVENLVKEYQRGALGQWITANKSHYRAAKEAGFVGSKTDFNIRVAQAGRRGDVDPQGNEFVTQAAKDARDKIFNPLLERAIRNGQLPEGIEVKTAPTYVHRMWNRTKLIGQESQFREIARQHFKGEIEKLSPEPVPSPSGAGQGADEELVRKATPATETDLAAIRQKSPLDKAQKKKIDKAFNQFEIDDDVRALIEDAAVPVDRPMVVYRGRDGDPSMIARTGRSNSASIELSVAETFGGKGTPHEAIGKITVMPGTRVYSPDSGIRGGEVVFSADTLYDLGGRNADGLYEIVARPKMPGQGARTVDDLATETAQMREGYKSQARAKQNIPDFVSKEDMDDYIEEIVTSVFNNLTGRGRGDMPEWMVPATRGPLKDRTFNIADDLVEDFLENDMEMVLRRYVRTMGAEVELHEKFGRADMRDQLDAINKEYDQLSQAAKTEAERVKLDTNRDRDLKNIEAFRDMVRGTYRAAEEGSEWSKITRAALSWNYIRLLGGVTLTSLSDTSRLIGVHGMRNTMKEALPALVSNLKAAKIAKQDARDLGAVTEMVLQSRIATMADLNDPYRSGSAFDRYMANATNMFSRATGLGLWNDTVKTMASVMTQNRMARNALGWAKAGQRERAYMAMLGINEDMATRIARQLKKYGTEEQGIWGADVSRWDDPQARRAWGAALNKDVDRTIITKGVSDTPLWMKSNWGRLIMQFKSFGLASHQRVLIAGLQERPERLAAQMAFGTAIGMMVAYLKMIERGDTERAENLLNNPGLWIADGLDRTGILSLPFEVSNTADKLSASYGGPNIGIAATASALAGDESASGGVTRYASRNAAGAVLGPSLGLFEDLAQILTALNRGDMGKGDANAVIRQIPGATLPGVRSAIHVGIKPELYNAIE